MLVVLVLFMASAAGSSKGQELADAAVQARLSVDAGGSSEDYLAAAEAFRVALRHLPRHSEDAHEIRWYLADTLLLAQAWTEAAEQYERLLRDEDEHPFGDGAAYQRMRCRQRIAGSTSARPEGAVVERTYQTEWGKTITVYRFSPESEAALEAIDAVLARAFAPVESGQADWAATVEQNRAVLLFQTSEILIAHGRYPEARERLRRLTSEDEVVCIYAAAGIVDTYLAEGDLGAVRRETREVCGMAPPQPPGHLAPEAAMFRKAMELIESGDRFGAAVVFLDFVERYPESENRRLALYNAATSYDVEGAAAVADALYERYVAEYPKDERSASLWFRIASNRESIFDLAGAIRAYESLLQHFPKDTNAPDAQYNAAFLAIGLGDHRGAARGFEQYADRYPDTWDAQEVHLRAGAEWEKVSATEAIVFYEGFLSRWGDSEPNLTITVHERLATLYATAGDRSAAARHADATTARFDAAVLAGEKVHEEQRHAAAIGPFLLLEKQFADLRAQPANRVATDRAREAARALELRFEDFETSAGARYLAAQALHRLGDVDGAQAELIALIAFSRDRKRASPWVDRAEALLNELDPTFPAHHRELRAQPPPGVEYLPPLRPVPSSDVPPWLAGYP